MLVTVLCRAEENVGDYAVALALRLCQVGSDAVAEQLLLAVNRDVENGQPLKALAVHDSRLYYGRTVVGSMP